MVKLDKFYFLGKFVFGFGISTELWHTERKSGGKVVHFLHFGYTPDLSPERSFKASLLVLTFIFLTMRIGICRKRKNID
jgi:hypothetical protein|nr:MAG TPA: hypothetical protein [Caudoviricetes sp.]